jgi:hypothetical protein
VRYHIVRELLDILLKILSYLIHSNVQGLCKFLLVSREERPLVLLVGIFFILSHSYVPALLYFRQDVLEGILESGSI